MTQSESEQTETEQKPEEKLAGPEASRAGELAFRIASYLLFFLSGAAALVYEISWSRQIGLLFGHTVHAASIVLAAYFGGMAIGYLIGGARRFTRVNPLAAYGVAEIVVALWALLVPAVLNGVYSSSAVGLLSQPSFALQTAVRGLFCFLLLLPGTAALGFTLPMMADFLASWRSGRVDDATSAARISFAYSLNTAGALSGVLLATYYLLMTFGVQSSSYVAAGASALCGLVALALSSKSGSQQRNSEVAGTQGSVAREHVVLAALSGFGILGLQVLYTRMFSLVFHNSTYTFGAVVAVFLFALALGSALASLLQRVLNARTLIGWSAALGAIAIAVSIRIFVEQTDLKYFLEGDSFTEYLREAFLLVLYVVGPPVTLLGMMLPLIWKIAGKSASAGRVVGSITAVNTIAASIGSIAASFLLLPNLGLWSSFVLLAATFFLTAAYLMATSGNWLAIGGAAVAMIALSYAALQTPSDADTTEKRGEQVVKRWNSAYGWIDVIKVESSGSYKVRQNLHYRFGATGVNAREFRQAHIPLVLHPEPKDVCFLGLGTGLTAGGAVPHRELESIVAVELIPEVIEAARYIGEYNNHVVDFEKTETFADDARHYLLATERQFDVIVSDMFVPWESETGYLYTVEHYQLAQRKLRDGGVFCQWLPLYQVGEREFELIANSFASVFPNTTIWWGQVSESKPVVALIGSTDAFDVDSREVQDRLVSIWEELGAEDRYIVNFASLSDMYMGDWVFDENALLNTDEFPRVEFLTPVSNRDFKLLSNTTFAAYYRETLETLPWGGFRPGGTKIDEPTMQQQRMRMRKRVFGE